MLGSKLSYQPVHASRVLRLKAWREDSGFTPNLVRPFILYNAAMSTLSGMARNQACCRFILTVLARAFGHSRNGAGEDSNVAGDSVRSGASGKRMPTHRTADHRPDLTRDLRQTHPDATPHAQARLWHVSCSRAGLPTAGHPRGIPQETCQSLPDPTTLAFMTTVWRRSRPPATCLDVCNDTTPGGFGQPSRGRPSQAPLGCATIPN